MQDTDPAPSPSPAARLAAWIRLEQAPGVGRLTAGSLLARFHTPDAIFAASHGTLASLVSPRQADALLAAPAPDYLERALAWDAVDNQHILTLDDPRYPALLREIADPPLLLYAIGRTELLAGPALAIVG
ncbi:MAG: DNA-processing protein DprA, partial [Telluria sp.]|nr:DNA-processing protein DprA [Telluria sp.]